MRILWITLFFNVVDIHYAYPIPLGRDNVMWVSPPEESIPTKTITLANLRLPNRAGLGNRLSNIIAVRPKKLLLPKPGVPSREGIPSKTPNYTAGAAMTLRCFFGPVQQGSDSQIGIPKSITACCHSRLALKDGLSPSKIIKLHT